MESGVYKLDSTLLHRGYTLGLAIQRTHTIGV